MSLDIRMDNLERRMNDLCKTIKDEVPTMDKMELSNRRLIEEIIINCDKKYASKETENIVRKLLWSFIGGVIAIITGIVVFSISFLITK